MLNQDNEMARLFFSKSTNLAVILTTIAAVNIAQNELIIENLFLVSSIGLFVTMLLLSLFYCLDNNKYNFLKTILAGAIFLSNLFMISPLFYVANTISTTNIYLLNGLSVLLFLIGTIIIMYTAIVHNSDLAIWFSAKLITFKLAAIVIHVLFGNNKYSDRLYMLNFYGMMMYVVLALIDEIKINIKYRKNQLTKTNYLINIYTLLLVSPIVFPYKFIKYIIFNVFSYYPN